MATYYTNPSNQRDGTPMFYSRENMEASVIPGSMMMYMNSGSFSDSLPGNSQQNNSELLSAEDRDSAAGQQELLSVYGGSRLGEQDYSAWREGKNEMLLMQSVGSTVLDGHSLQGQGLSLSLSTQIPTFPYRNPNQDFGSFSSPNPSPSGFSGGDQDSHKADLSPYGMSNTVRSIPGSKYLKAAQQLLDEVVNVRNALKLSDPEKNKNRQLEKSGKEGDGVHLNPQESTCSAPSELSHAERQDLQYKLTKLLAMLDEVDRRYKQYYHQMHIVVSSFEAVAGCGSTKPYTSLALQTISRHFRCLRNAITSQIQVARKSLGEQDTSGNVKGVGISRLRFVDKQLRQQRALQQLGMMQHAWRPQRGLPESSVSILRAWLFEHFLHPYPKDSDKTMLARQTGLTRSQVSNWFINARVRLWKPMVEEMYKEEAEEAEMESNSSSENAGKGTRPDIREDIQQNSSSAADHIPEMELMGAGGDSEPEHNLLRHRDEGFMAAAYQMPEMGILGTGNGVSLTLGLQHCDGGNRPPVLVGIDHSFGRVSASGGSAGREAAEFECVDGGNQQNRFSSAQLCSMKHG